MTSTLPASALTSSTPSRRSAGISSLSSGVGGGAMNNVSYETFAPRSTTQVTRLSRIAALTAGPTARALTREEGQSISSPQKPNNLLLQVMSPPAAAQSLDTDHTSRQIQVQQTLVETDTVVNELTQQLKHTTSLRLAVRASINIAEDISNRHAELIRHSGELSAAADRLQEEEKMLSRHAQEIGMPLLHYDAVDRIGLLVGVLFKGTTTVRGLAKTKVDSDEFPTILEDIDKAIVYFGQECGGKEALKAELKAISKATNNPQQQKQIVMTSGSVEYYRRALALQEAALDLIKEAVAERIANTTSQISAALNLAKGNTVQADQLEASLIYTRFHGISSRSNRLLSLVRARLRSNNNNSGSGTGSSSIDTGVTDAYQELLQHCRQTYCASRELLLRNTVHKHMERLKEQHGPVGMTRLASVFLIRLCTVETALYLDFFGESKKPTAETTATEEGEDNTHALAKRKSSPNKLAEDGATAKEADFQAYLTSLCSALHRTVRRSLVTMLDLDTLCQIVSVLREERSMASSTPTTMAAARAISSVIQDAQERLIFCANSTLSKDVVKFKPKPADLDYPAKLRPKETTTTPATLSSSTSAESGANDDDAMEQQLQQVYESWFPPMRTVLKILSKLFRVVESSVFEDIALHSVQACTRCLKEGAAHIRLHGGEMHADLFLVKHLLILREQLSPFDIELRSVERQLDFSDAGKAVARFLANRNRRIFSVSTENALVTLLREGVSVQESDVDSKRDLEDALRSACNDFIEHTSNSVAKDLLATVEAYKMADSAASLASETVCGGDSVVGMLQKMLDTLEVSLGEITSQMGLYLGNPATQSILLKPVTRKITRALDDVRKLAAKLEDGVNSWDAEKRSKVTELTLLLERNIKASTRTAK